MWCGWEDQATLAYHSDCSKALEQKLLLGDIDKATT